MEGLHVNHKRVYRIYHLNGLGVKPRRRRKGLAIERLPLLRPDAPNLTWSMDFVMDALASRRRVGCLTCVDDFTKECLTIATAFGITGVQVKRILDSIVLFHGYPAAIRTDQGPKFTCRVLDQWAFEHGVELRLIQLGKPTQNGLIDSFNGRFRDECLNEHWFSDIIHAREIINDRRQDYNECRPHSSLDYQTPAEFAVGWRNGKYEEKPDPDPKSCSIQKQNSGMIFTPPRAEVVPMKKSRFTEGQIVFDLKQAELGTPVPEVCRKLGISDATFYTWRKKYGGISLSELKHMRQLEEENLRLKKLVAYLRLGKAMLQDVLAKKS